MTELPKSCTDGIDPPIAEPGGEAPAGASPIGGASPNDSTPEAMRGHAFRARWPRRREQRVRAGRRPGDEAAPRPARPANAAAAMRDASFDWLAEGFTHQEIAAVRKVSVAVVRRDIARAIRARQIETRDGHAQLQIARLTKGLAFVTHRIERGDMAAVGPLVKLVTALDRYHGPEDAPTERPQVRLQSRKPSVALPAPPLAIAHLAAPKAQDATPDAGEECQAAFGQRLD